MPYLVVSSQNQVTLLGGEIVLIDLGLVLSQMTKEDLLILRGQLKDLPDVRPSCGAGGRG